MAMRSGSYGYCEECQRSFAYTPGDPPGTIRHPAASDYPDMPPALAALYAKCPNAGKLFKQPVMEEVE